MEIISKWCPALVLKCYFKGFAFYVKYFTKLTCEGYISGHLKSIMFYNNLWNIGFSFRHSHFLLLTLGQVHVGFIWSFWMSLSLHLRTRKGAWGSTSQGQTQVFWEPRPVLFMIASHLALSLVPLSFFINVYSYKEVSLILCLFFFHTHISRTNCIVQNIFYDAWYVKLDKYKITKDKKSFADILVWIF